MREGKKRVKMVPKKERRATQAKRNTNKKSKKRTKNFAFGRISPEDFGLIGKKKKT